MRKPLTLFLAFLVNGLLAQDPSAQFDIPGTVCRSQSLALVNNSMYADTYLWDFCEGDLSDIPTLSGSPTTVNNGMTGVKLIKDGNNWYGFMVNFTSSELFRLDFGTDITSEPMVTNLENPDDMLDKPYQIELYNEGGTWYGLVTNDTGSSLVRLDFGSVLTSSPSAELVTITGSALSAPRGISIAEDGGNVYALIGNFSTTVIHLDFGNSITNDAFGSAIAGTTQTFDTKLIQSGSNWYGIVSRSQASSDMYKIDFGNSLANPPSLQNYTFTPSIGALTMFEVFNDAGIYYVLVSSTSGNVFRVELDSDLSGTSGTVTDYGAFGVFSLIFAMDVVKEGSNYHLFPINFNPGSLRRLDFPNPCSANIGTSVDFEPQGINYSSSDTYKVTLSAINSDGIIDRLTKDVAVSTDIAPDINFSVSNSQCLGTTITFTSTNISGNIQTYSWDFGDGTIIGPDPGLSETTHDYSSTGQYEVLLSVVSDDGCTNFAQQTIEIFNPPTADFDDIMGNPCSGEAINFTNTSTFDPGSPISYLWDFNGEGTSTDENPTFTFQFGGMKDVTLTTSIPGCSDMITKQVDVQFGAVPDFSFSNICLGEVATFTDLSNGAGTTITDWDWDFGDGNISTLQNPTNPYAATGDYNVSLTVTNDLGCAVTDIQTISVHANPVASFTNDPACEGPVQFTDQTTVEFANITQWLWDFDNGDTSTEEDPIANFSQSTEFDVNLIATSNFGCSDEITQTISVQSAPTPEFTIDQACLGEPVQFNDQSIIESINPVTSYFWEIEDEVYSVMNPEHTFSSVGTFTARMTLTVANGCVVVSEQQVVVPAEPTPEFSNTNPCVNSVTTFEDQSLDEGDPIVSRTWDFDGLATANGPMTQFVFTEPGNYNISLTTTSTLGCTAFIGKTITVNEQPMAAFNASATLGPPPLSVNFTNQSEEATSFSWLLNDNVDPFSFEEHAALLFEEEGDFAVSLVAFNGFGCTDTLTQIIEVVFPATDLALDEVIAVPNNGKTNIVLRGANRGTLAIDGFDIVINIEDDITLIEEFDQTLLKSQPFVHTLNFDLQGEESNVEFICIDLQLREVEESNRDNNQQCINFEQEVIIQEPFPNPTSENLRVNVLIPEVSDGVQVTLMNIYGEIIIDEMIDEPLEGLNIFDFNVNALTSGLYVVRIRYDGVEEVRRVRKE